MVNMLRAISPVWSLDSFAANLFHRHFDISSIAPQSELLYRLLAFTYFDVVEQPVFLQQRQQAIMERVELLSESHGKSSTLFCNSAQSPL